LKFDVMLIDDNATNLTVLKHLIAAVDKKYTPLLFEDPKQALLACESAAPDLVFVDYMMPELDGVSFIKQFRAIKSCQEVPVVMVTADYNKDIRYEALQAGANDFLNKPLDKTEFLARATNLIALRTGQRQLSNRAEWLSTEVKKATLAIKSRELEAVVLLSKAAEFRDPETGEHIVRMSHYSKVIGERLGLPTETLDLLLEASPMHDIGKVGTPDHILLKPGKLDFNEFEEMKKHAVYGYEILKNSSSPVLRMGADIAISHHEKWNGKGYPKGLSGEAIPLVGRIVAVADVFDALTSVRPYKPAWEVERALNLIREESGQHFDPACVDAFFEGLDTILAIKDANQENFDDVVS